MALASWLDTAVAARGLAQELAHQHVALEPAEREAGLQALASDPARRVGTHAWRRPERMRSMPSTLRLRPVSLEKKPSARSSVRDDGAHRHCSVPRSVPASAVLASCGRSPSDAFLQLERPCSQPSETVWLPVA